MNGKKLKSKYPKRSDRLSMKGKIKLKSNQKLLKNHWGEDKKEMIVLPKGVA